MRHALVLPAAVLAGALALGCTDLPTTTEKTSEVSFLSQPVLGSYDLEFLWSGTELTIVAHVRDAEGGAPDGGRIVIQYCSYNGFPTDDIEQPDEAPSSACADRTAHWVTLAVGRLDPNGNASLDFGRVTVVTVIGFRLQYFGQGSGIQNKSIVEDWYRPL
jgi:hypothetical protein